jgi:hypothetical protein
MLYFGDRRYPKWLHWPNQREYVFIVNNYVLYDLLVIISTFHYILYPVLQINSLVFLRRAN